MAPQKVPAGFKIAQSLVILYVCSSGANLSYARKPRRKRAGWKGVAVSLLNEFWKFLRVRKKFWLLPIVTVVVLFGVLLVLAESSALAPFIYTLF